MWWYHDARFTNLEKINKLLFHLGPTDFHTISDCAAWYRGKNPQLFIWNLLFSLRTDIIWKIYVTVAKAEQMKRQRCLTEWITQIHLQTKMTIVSIFSWKHSITAKTVTNYITSREKAAVWAMSRSPSCLIYSRWSSFKAFMLMSFDIKKNLYTHKKSVFSFSDVQCEGMITLHLSIPSTVQHFSIFSQHIVSCLTRTLMKNGAWNCGDCGAAGDGAGDAFPVFTWRWCDLLIWRMWGRNDVM